VDAETATVRSAACKSISDRVPRSHRAPDSRVLVEIVTLG